MRPDHSTRDLILGVLGRAQSRHQMRIVAFVFLSNHFHLLLLPDSPQQLASFMAYLASNIAREVGRIHDWREKFWSRRYRAITVSDEEVAQVARLRYLLAHGAKEGFVATPRDWPGPHSIFALESGAVIQGTWFDRSAAYRARRRDSATSLRDFASTEIVTLTTLPCWTTWSEDRRRAAIAELVVGIEREAALARVGKAPAGRKALLKASPHARPTLSKRSHAPAFHVATKVAWEALRAAYRIFAAAFRRAAERLRSGDRTAEFPDGSFPPALPFVSIPIG